MLYHLSRSDFLYDRFLWRFFHKGHVPPSRRSHSVWKLEKKFSCEYMRNKTNDVEDVLLEAYCTVHEHSGR